MHGKFTLLNNNKPLCGVEHTGSFEEVVNNQAQYAHATYTYLEWFGDTIVHCVQYTGPFYEFINQVEEVTNES